MQCEYCTAEAVGLDEDGDPTCNSWICTPAVQPLPSVIEISDDDDWDGDEGVDP